MRLVLFLSMMGCDRLDRSGSEDDSCDPSLFCEPEVTEECTGSLTSVEVDHPSVCSDQTLTHDVPDEGYPLGETELSFAAGADTCTTRVTVIDTQAPVVECDEAITLVRTGDEPVEIPEPWLSDGCDGAPSYQTDLTSLEIGSQTVTYTAQDASGNLSNCTSEITVLDVPAATDLQVLSASLSDDGQTSVLLGWGPSPGSDVDFLAIEEADDAEGLSWTEVGEVSADALSYRLEAFSGAPRSYRLTSRSGDETGGSTDSIQVHPIRAITYDLREVEVDRVPFATTLYGVVRAPAETGAGPYPLIVLLHGNHGNCRRSEDSEEDYCSTSQDHECAWSEWVTTPNAEGMAFQAETLAAQGYVAVSISGNAMNCRNDYILERSALIVEHLRTWRDWNQEDSPLGSDYIGAIDLSRIGLVGHSRGGDAVSHVPTMLQTSPEEGITVESVFAIAPTDFHGAEVLDTHYATLLPACDGDVSTLSGREIYDRSVQDGNPVLQAQALYIGANHNFFSTEWAVNDGSWVCTDEELVGKQAQQGWLEAALGPWFQTTLGSGEFRPDIRGEGGVPGTVEEWAGRDLDVRWSYSSDDRLRIDDLEGTDAPEINLLGEANEFTGFITAQDCTAGSCGSSFDHQKSAIVLKWSDEEVAQARFGLGEMDLTEFSVLSFRVSSRNEGWNNVRTVQDAWLVVQDSDGDEAAVQLSEIQRIGHGYEGSHETDVLQTVRLDLASLSPESSDLNMDRIQAFLLEFPSDGLRGSLYLTDIELSR